MRKILLVLIIAFGFFGEVNAMDNAGIYLSKKANMSVEGISSLAKGASVEVISSENGKSFHVSWSDVSIKINMKNKWSDRSVQINGMSNRIKSFGSQDKSVNTLLETVNASVDLLGCVIEPGYDREEKISNLVKLIAKEYDGFIFTHQSFYSENGEKIVGKPGDPDSI